MKKVRILSIDGGGIRGILPGSILTYLEKRIQDKTGNKNATIGEYFDLLAGTSTGGILSLVYICPDNKGKYKFNAKQAVSLYLQQGDDIFDVSVKRKIKTLGGLKDEKYDAAELEDSLREYFGETKLKDALKPCLITSYDIRNRQAKFFTSHDADDEIHDFYFRDVARATSAAPTYFEPARVKSMFGTPYPLIDGGVFANNPTLCAYSEARSMSFDKILGNPEKPNKPTAKDMILVSIGTGTVENAYHYKDFKDAGMVKWIKPLIDIMMSGNSETVDYQLRQIFDTLPAKHKKDYYRIQPEIKTADTAMDNADVANLRALAEDGKRAVEDFQSQLNEIADKLIENA